MASDEERDSNNGQEVMEQAVLRLLSKTFRLREDFGLKATNARIIKIVDENSCKLRIFNELAFPTYPDSIDSLYREKHDFFRDKIANRLIAEFGTAHQIHTEYDIITGRLDIARYFKATTFSQIKPEPNKMVPPDTELDVYIKETGCDIECRNMMRDLSANDDDVKRIAYGMVKQKIQDRTEAFNRLEITKVIFVTNLSKVDASRLNDAMMTILKDRQISIAITVTSEDVDGLLQVLDSESKQALGKANKIDLNGSAKA